LVVVITVIRQRRLDLSDVGSFVTTFLSGSNIPAAAYLFLYVFNPDPLLAQTKLAGYEKYIAVAGLVLFLASVIAVWNLCRNAFKKSPPVVTPPSMPGDSA
jgi:hypothetical protein